ncbi:hypothetical protein MCOR27_008544 [Pyricularia oryzae]|uniref:General alpha-glucoside permease n=2 Tax=Pyricularia TaxID=48558 RepID=A0ABQ8N4M6_PYRGI|nr:hypothetical protein MCOR01_004847 [Pyricularia oryzae]KAI6290383.1 hypothetical protein MCOR33_011352 [Pyricularia grisea]KAI6255303.1 hypothetical protein MCOR19_008221 [Pyricularia oryzae]KAI6269559.1 hypothetical protein MCOR26_008635 [Pyricularia oryzae]KAI6272004.1 hypothetical protein MCOR27_008544 [Pyricularia oryzae]
MATSASSSFDDPAEAETAQLMFEFDDFAHQPPAEPLSTRRLLLLTCPSLGLQVCWFLLQTSGTPCLRSLGITPSWISLIWALGPIFGAFVQPVIGQLSDELHHPLGRRKPVMLAGAGAVISSVLAMACALALAPPDAQAWWPRAVAVGCLVVLLFAINAYSVGVRAIVVDVCPAAQQPAAAAWAMRWNVLGSAALSALGVVSTLQGRRDADPVAVFLKLALVAAVLSAVTVGLVCVLVSDTVPPRPKVQEGGGGGVGRVLAMCRLGEIYRRWGRLPPVTGQVCGVQLFAWLGWFPVLYYMSTYAYETALYQASHLTDPEAYAEPYPLYASLSFALGTLLSTLMLTLLTATRLLAPAHLPRLWLCSQLLAAVSLLLTMALRTTAAALVLLALVGATWAVTMWVPFALINTELAELGSTGVAGAQGLHNMAVSLPQVASALLCACVLAGLGMLGMAHGAVWLLRLAAVPVGWSTWLIWRLDGGGA